MNFGQIGGKYLSDYSRLLKRIEGQRGRVGGTSVGGARTAPVLGQPNQTGIGDITMKRYAAEDFADHQQALDLDSYEQMLKLDREYGQGQPQLGSTLSRNPVMNAPGTSPQLPGSQPLGQPILGSPVVHGLNPDPSKRVYNPVLGGGQPANPYNINPANERVTDAGFNPRRPHDIDPKTKRLRGAPPMGGDIKQFISR